VPWLEVVYRGLVGGGQPGGRDSQDAVVAAAGADVGADVQGDGQGPAVVVVGVFADEVDPAG
jgi:hypothetical protein